MRIISSFMDDVRIVKGCYHTITFESSYLQQLFRKLLSNYYSNKYRFGESDYYYLDIVDNNSKASIKKGDLLVINFDCNVVDLKDEKSTEQMLHNLLFYYLENNPNLLSNFLQFNEDIQRFISAISLNAGKLKIGFEFNDKMIRSFIKSLNINFEYDHDYIPNYIVREYLIKSLLELNKDEKEVLLIISYPETDVGRKDFKTAIDYIKKLKVTTIVLTAEHDFITSAGIDKVNLVDENGTLYDTVGLKQELEEFDIIDMNNRANLAKSIAFYDFTKNYALLPNRIKRFLNSNSF